MRIAEVGDLAMLQLPNNKQTIFRLETDREYQTHKGSIFHNDLIGSPWGRDVETHLGTSYIFLPPTLHDLVRNTRRISQIIFPKDIGYILLRLSIGPGTRVLEAQENVSDIFREYDLRDSACVADEVMQRGGGGIDRRLPNVFRHSAPMVSL